MDKALREFAQRVFAGQDPVNKPCEDCGGVHTRACPRIASIRVVLSQAGTTMSITERDVTYWAPGLWEEGIIWPDDVWEEDSDGEADGSSSQ